MLRIQQCWNEASTPVRWTGSDGRHFLCHHASLPRTAAWRGEWGRHWANQTYGHVARGLPCMQPAICTVGTTSYGSQGHGLLTPCSQWPLSNIVCSAIKQPTGSKETFYPRRCSGHRIACWSSSPVSLCVYWKPTQNKEK